MSRPLRVLLPLAEHDAALAAAVTLRSLRQPRNLPAVAADGASVLVDVRVVAGDAERVAASLERAGNGLALNVVAVRSDDEASARAAALADAADAARAEGGRLLLTEAGWFFGNGTLAAAIRYGGYPGRCVSGALFPVHESSFCAAVAARDVEEPIGNAELVALAFAHVADAKNGAGRSVAYRRLDDNLAVVAAAPSRLLLLDVTDADVAFFRSRARADAVGDDWWNLAMGEDRVRIIASSDAWFVADATAAAAAPIDDAAYVARTLVEQRLRSIYIALRAAEATR